MEKVSDPPLPSYFHLKIHNFETQKSVPKLWIGRRRSTSGNWKSSLTQPWLGVAVFMQFGVNFGNENIFKVC